MPDRSYLQHGRRHTSTGTDPIPGLGPVAAANLEFFVTPLTLAAGGEGNIGWDAFETTDTNVFGTNDAGAFAGITNTTGDHCLVLLEEGFYLALGDSSWDTGVYPRYSFVDVVGDSIYARQAGEATEYVNDDTFAGTTGAGSISTNSVKAIHVAEGNQVAVFTVVKNLDTLLPHDVTNADLTVLFWPTIQGSVTVY